MKNTGKLSRIFLAFGLLLSLGVAPTLTVYAQQSAPQAESPAAKTQQAAEQKKQASETEEQKLSSEDEPLPLSDAEMEKVEGGFAFLVPAAWFAGSVVAGVAANAIWNKVHKNYCTPTRRR